MSDEFEKRFEEIERRLDNLEKVFSEKKSRFEFSDNIFEEQDGKIFVTKYRGKDTKEATKNIVLLTLLGWKEKKGVDNVSASALKESVAIHQISLNNFGTHLNELIPQSVMRKGKKGSNKVTYRLTTFGNAKARKLMEELSKNE